jgi:hypothetical protein
MKGKLPHVINVYVKASNAHDVKAILACFSGRATVRDEGKTVRGLKAIERWILRTIQQYQFHFKPLGVRDDDAGTVVTMEVSGTFDGSPARLEYRFVVEHDKIASLVIT